MHQIGAKIKRMRENRHLTQAELAQKSGVSLDSIKKYEANSQKNITLDNLFKISKVLKVDLNFFADEMSLSGEMSLNKKMSLSPQEMSLSVSLSPPKMSSNVSKSQIVSVPVYDEVVASAGSGRFNDDFKAFSVEFDKAHLKRLFALANVDNLAIIRASGDSMTPTLPPNARLLLQFRTEFKEGQIVACRLDDELFVKRLHKQPRLRLVSDNEKFEPIELGGKDYELIGVIVGFIKAFE